MAELTQAQLDAYNSNPQFVAAMTALQQQPAAGTVTAAERQSGQFEASTSPYQGSAAAGEWLTRYLGAGNSTENVANAAATAAKPTIAQIAWNEKNGIPNPTTTVPPGGETVGGGVFGGWSGVGTPVSATGANIYQQKQTHESPFTKTTPGQPGGLLTQARGAAGGGTGTGGTGGTGGSTGGAAPGANNVGYSRGGSTGGATGGPTRGALPPGTPAPGTYPPPGPSTGISPAGPPGTTGPGQNAGYSTNGSQLLLDGTPWLDPATLAQAQQAQASTTSAVTRQVTPNELAGVRMAELLSQNSMLMERAKMLGLTEAAKRGLLNSSIAVGSAMGAMADRAQPLALQEASAYGTAASENMASQNVANNLNAQLLTDVSKTNAGMGTDVALSNAASINRRNELMFDFNRTNFLDKRAFDYEMQRLAQVHANDKEKLALTQQYQKELNEDSEKSTNLRQASTMVANADSNYSAQVVQILSDPKKPADQVAKELAAAKKVRDDTYRAAETLFGVDLGDWESAGTGGTQTVGTAPNGVAIQANGLPVGWSATTYLQKNPDVAAAAKTVGMSPEEYAAWHWKNAGQNEPGRW